MSVVPVLPSNPSIGVDLGLQLTTDGYGKPRLRTVSFVFTASAAAANRFVRLSLTDSGDHVLWMSENNVAQVAGVACQYSFALGGGSSSTEPSTNTISRTSHLPDMLWVSGNQLKTVIAGIDVGDQISGVTYQLEDREGC